MLPSPFELSLAGAISGAVAVPPHSAARAGMLARVLGLYMAICAGTIQLLDIIVDRLGLPDRLFFFAIVLAVVGLPIVVTSTLLLDIAAADRRLPARVRATPHDAARSAKVAAAAVTVEPRTAQLQATSYGERGPGAHVELALSYLRIADIQRESGAADDAGMHEAAFLREAERAVTELSRLIEEVRRRES